MLAKYSLNALAILLIVFIQLSFVSALPSFLHSDLFLVVSVFILVLSGPKIALVWSVAGGVIFDMYSFTPFGTHLFAYIIALSVSYLILVNFLTDRSLYSFMTLSFISSVVFFIVSGIFISSGRLLGFYAGSALDLDYMLNAIFEIARNLISSLIIFYLAGFVTNRLRPVFLIRKKI